MPGLSSSLLCWPYVENYVLSYAPYTPAPCFPMSILQLGGLNSCSSFGNALLPSFLAVLVVSEELVAIVLKV